MAEVVLGPENNGVGFAFPELTLEAGRYALIVESGRFVDTIVGYHDASDIDDFLVGRVVIHASSPITALGEQTG